MHTVFEKHLKNRTHMFTILKINLGKMSLSSETLSLIARLYGGKWGIATQVGGLVLKQNSHLEALLIFLISIFKPRYLCMRK